MRLPPFFKDLPNDAIKRVVDLLNQPQLVQTVKDAAKQLGATTEWGASQVQDSMKQAKRWLESVSQRWQASAPYEALPIINASGYVFPDGYSHQPVDQACNAAYLSAFAGTIDEKSIRSQLEQTLIDVTGAEAALVVHNVAVALQLIAMLPAGRDGWIAARTAGVRLPDGGAVFATMRQFGKIAEVGTNDSISV